MKSRRCLYGSLGLLSMLGLIGIFTEAKSFLAFFAFAVDFQYFFLKSDEMLEAYMNKSASRGFYCGMIATALVTLVCSSPAGAGKKRPCWRALRPGGRSLSWSMPSPLPIMDFRSTGGWRMIRNKIKEYRARHDMKQEDLARLVGVRRETIGNLEKGRYNPSLVLAWNIAKVFGVSIEEIFSIEE